jgi:hypothetical protein
MMDTTKQENTMSDEDRLSEVVGNTAQSAQTYCPWELAFCDKTVVAFCDRVPVAFCDSTALAFSDSMPVVICDSTALAFFDSAALSF